MHEMQELHYQISAIKGNKYSVLSLLNEIIKEIKPITKKYLTSLRNCK